MSDHMYVYMSCLTTSRVATGALPLHLVLLLSGCMYVKKNSPPPQSCLFDAISGYQNSRQSLCDENENEKGAKFHCGIIMAPIMYLEFNFPHGELQFKGNPSTECSPKLHQNINKLLTEFASYRCPLFCCSLNPFLLNNYSFLLSKII